MNSHGGSLRQETGDEALTRQIIQDYRKAQVDDRTMQMLRFAEKLTRRPREMSRADVAPLREAGMSDEDILDLVLVVGYFSYINRMGTALGVDPEP